MSTDIAKQYAEIAELLDEIENLPTIPAVLNRVSKLMQDPKATAQEVATVLSEDQSLALRILKVVNSPFYGFPRQISTITHAIIILGFNSVRMIAISSSVFSALKQKKKTVGLFNRNAFWQHSIGVGVAARVIGNYLGIKETEELFLAGLIHDIGKVIIDEYLHEQFEAIVYLTLSNNISILEAEKEILNGLSHTSFGGWLSKKWNLDEIFEEITLHHHNPQVTSKYYQYSCIIHIANALCRCLEMGHSGDDLVMPIQHDAWNTIGLESKELPKIFSNIKNEFLAASVFLRMN